MKRFGERLRIQRNKRGVTQQWMAEQLVVDRTTYSKYESGRVEPSLEGLCQIADVLQCSVDWLLGRE